ncbi:MAG: hypothetical protein ABF959_09045 [Gluconobacter albidus]
MKRFVFAMMAVFGVMGGHDCLADPNTHSIAKWDIYDPTLYGIINGNVTFKGVVLFPDPAAGNNSQQVATTAWVNAAIAANGSGGGSSGTFCSTSGCTFSGNGGSVTITPWNWQGYNALAMGGMITFTNGNGVNVCLTYYDDGGGSNPSVLLKSASLRVDGRIYVNTQEQPASSTESCARGETMYGSGYLYYCISDGKWGRTPWQTGW